MNKIISVISNKTSKQNQYEINGVKYDGGYSSSVAPIHYCVIDSNNEDVEIIPIVSTKAQDSYLDLKQQKFITEVQNVHICDPFHIGDDFRTDELIDFLDKISEKLDMNDKIYIDMTGGFRSASTLLIALIRLLKIRGISVHKVVYASLNEDVTDTYKKISFEEKTELYHFFDLISGLDEFEHTGNACSIKDYFKKNNDKVSNEFKEIVGLVDLLSENIRLQQANSLTINFLKLKEQIEKYQPKHSDEKIMIDYFKTVFAGFEFNETEINAFSLIDWCLKRHLVQTAYAILIDILPRQLLNKKIIQIHDDALKCYKEKMTDGNRVYNNTVAGREFNVAYIITGLSDCKKYKILDNFSAYYDSIDLKFCDNINSKELFLSIFRLENKVRNGYMHGYNLITDREQTVINNLREEVDYLKSYTQEDRALAGKNYFKINAHIQELEKKFSSNTFSKNKSPKNKKKSKRN